MAKQKPSYCLITQMRLPILQVLTDFIVFLEDKSKKGREKKGKNNALKIESMLNFSFLLYFCKSMKIGLS